MTKKAYELIQLVLQYGYVNFKGGIESVDSKIKSIAWNTFTKQDEELYEKICKAVRELDEGGEDND